MGYRGEDLDLRTPQPGGRPADLAGGDISGPRSRTGYSGRSEPIWVDDTVLACCNLAYDLAVTHRAGEVRLEHLIYALTRIDSAAEALEGRGVRVAALRREMGGIVASEIPIGLPNGKGTPRRSEELEALLRDAADLAHRRNSPANIDDLVAVLIDSTRDLPSLMYLRRHLSNRVADRVDHEPMLRGREPAIRPYAAPAYEPRAAWSDPLPAMASRTDVQQNSRIEALEQAVRSLSTDLGNERKTMSNLLLDIQRDVGLRRDDDSRLGGGMIDRLGAVEHAIEKRLSELSRTWTALNDRLQMIESAVRQVRPDGGGIELVALHDRLTGLERAIQSSSGDSSRHWTVVADRFKSIEASLLSRAPGAVGVDVSRLAERFDSIEQLVLERASEGAAEATRLAERLKAIEDGQAAQKVQALQLNAGLAAEVNKLASAITQQPAIDRSLPMLNERFQALGAMIERQRSELAGTLAQPLGERLTAIGSALETRQVEGVRAISTLAERVAAIERGMTGYVQKISEQAVGYDEDLGEIQDALVKLTNGQTTVAGTIEQWRQQGNEISTIGNRLAAIERLSMRPAQMIEQLAEKVDAIHRLTAEKIEKRNAFYYWLFGTSDWRGASWPKRAPRRAVQPTAVVQPLQQRQPPPAQRG